VREVEVGRRLERVRERVPEVQPLAHASVVRVAQAERRLVRRRGADVERAAGEQLGLDPFGLALAPLAFRQGAEQRLVDHDPRRPVERADEVLALRDVDRRLAADGGVDLPDERRRDRDPRNAAEVDRSGETGEVGERAAAERDDRPRPVESEAVAELKRPVRRLRLLAGGDLEPRDEPVPERLLGPRAVDAHHLGVGDERHGSVAGHEVAEQLERPELVVDPRRREDDPVGVVRDRVGDLAVERLALAVEPAEEVLVLRERPIGLARAFPGRVDVDVDEHRERPLAQRRPHLLRLHRAAAERDDRGRRLAEGLARERRLGDPELHLAALREERSDRDLRTPLQQPVGVDRAPSDPRRHLLGERRLPGAHEADEREVAVEGVQHLVSTQHNPSGSLARHCQPIRSR
jgi:hypothetical protein